jgi:hypothetical protein
MKASFKRRVRMWWELEKSFWRWLWAEKFDRENAALMYTRYRSAQMDYLWVIR